MDQALPQFIFLGLLIFVFYFMLIRPQKKRVQQHRNLIESLSVGDEVVTIGGLHGKVVAIDEEDVSLEVAPGTTLRFVKNAIARRVSEQVPADRSAAEE